MMSPQFLFAEEQEHVQRIMTTYQKDRDISLKELPMAKLGQFDYQINSDEL